MPRSRARRRIKDSYPSWSHRYGYISVAMLRYRDACCTQRRQFEQVFGSRMEVTEENLRLAVDNGIDIWWGADWFLSPEANGWAYSTYDYICEVMHEDPDVLREDRPKHYHALTVQTLWMAWEMDHPTTDTE